MRPHPNQFGMIALKKNCGCLTSAVNLKFLSFGVASSYRSFKFKNRTRIIKLLVPL